MMLLYAGEDTYRLRVAADLFRAEHPGAETIMGPDHDARDRVERLLKYPSLLGDRSVAVLIEPAAIGDLAPLLREHAETSDKDLLLLLVQPTTDAAGRKCAASLAKLAAKRTSFDPLSGAKMLEWISGFCTERGRRIERPAAAELVRRTGGDSWRVASELEKLCA